LNVYGFFAKRNGSRVACVLKTRSEFAGTVVQVSDYSLKRVSLTGLAESDVSAVGSAAELDQIILADADFVKVIERTLFD
jgi:hypothetical protein